MSLRRTFSTGVIGVIFVLGFTIFSYSVNAAGTYSFSFLKIQPGSRAQGMGGAFTALASDASGIYYNPAGLSQIYLPTVMFHHTQWFQDISMEYLAGVVPVNNRLRLAGSFGFLHLPQMTRYDIDPATGEALNMGSFSLYDMVGQLGMTYRITHSFSLGFQAKFLQEKIDDFVTNGFGFDFGFLYHLPINYVSIGGAIQNLGPGVRYETNVEKLPMTYRIGIAYQFPNTNFTLAMDAVQTLGESWRFYPGIETGLGNFLSLRTGYHFSQELENGYSFGVGINIKEHYQLNYSFMPFGELGNTHRAEFMIRFGDIVSGEHHERIAEKKNDIPRDLYATTRNYMIDYPESEEELPPPRQVSAYQIGKQVLLSWKPIYIKGVRYNIYVRIPGRTGIVKINDSPIPETVFNFTPRATDLEVEFFVTSVKDGKESDFSYPFKLQYRYLDMDF